MQELIKAIEKKKEGVGDLRAAAINWAEYCLRDMKDETLKRGLTISMALADFETHLEELK